MTRRPDAIILGLRWLALTMVAAVVVVVVRCGLSFFSYHSVRHMIPKRATSLPHPAMCYRVAHAVHRVARFVPGATCLTQAFALQWILAVRGYTSEICIGVAQEDGRLHAHAWVVSAGRVLIGDQAEGLHRFQQLTSITVQEF